MSRCFSQFNGYEVKDAAARRNIENLTEKNTILENRMNTFASLPDGATTADAEVADIRVGYNGETYGSAGEAVRAQAAALAAGLQDITPVNFNQEYVVMSENLLCMGTTVKYDTWVQEDGSVAASGSYHMAQLNVKEGEKYTFYNYKDDTKTEIARNSGLVIVVDAVGNVLYNKSSSSPVVIPAGGKTLYRNITKAHWNRGGMMCIKGELWPTEFIPYGAKALGIKAIDDSVVNAHKPYDNECNIPDYWKPYLDAKISEIKEKQSEIGRNCATFIQYTDFHLSTSAGHSPALIKYVADACNVRCILDSGDRSNRYRTNAKDVLLGNMATINKLFEGTLARTLPAIGNHDLAYAEYDAASDTYAFMSLTKGEAYSHYYAPFLAANRDIVFAESGNYFYYDDPIDKIRYISMDCFDVPNDDRNADGTPVYLRYTFAFSKAQVDWLADEALKTPKGYNVVLFSHHTPRNVAGVIVPAGGELVAAVLAAYNNHSTYTGGFTHETDANFNIPVRSYNFTDASGKVVVFTSGHMHKDRQRVWGGIYMRTMTLDSVDTHQGAEGYEEIIVKTKGTTTEHAFDVFTVNRETGDVYITRIGAGDTDADESFNFNNPVVG